jgi:GTPase SAR1 family protein
MVEQNDSRHEKFQLINEHAELMPGLTDSLQRIGIGDDEKNYAIVSIIGPQSSGKSTLLNGLFGTTFKTAEVAGPQTTQGIWVSRDQKNNIIVLDIEGSDSLEQQFRSTMMSSSMFDSQLMRQKSKEFYEFSTGLFALQMSNIFLINVLQNSSGQDAGSGFSVLRYILKLNIEIFKQRTLEEKKRIIVIIRDAFKQNYESNKARMMLNLQKEWELLEKPEDLAGKPIEELFHVEIVCLPHYVYCADDFRTQVREFHDVFVRNAENNKEQESINLPAGDIGDFATQIWEVIKTNQDVDIPAQKELLAEKQCHKVRKQILEKAEGDIENLSKVDDLSFGAGAQLIWEEAIKEYQAKAKKYQQKAVLQVQEELEKELLDRYKNVLRSFLRTIARRVRDLIDAEFEKQKT